MTLRTTHVSWRTHGWCATSTPSSPATPRSTRHTACSRVVVSRDACERVRLHKAVHEVVAGLVYRPDEVELPILAVERLLDGDDQLPEGRTGDGRARRGVLRTLRYPRTVTGESTVTGETTCYRHTDRPRGPLPALRTAHLPGLHGAGLGRLPVPRVHRGRRPSGPSRRGGALPGPPEVTVGKWLIAVERRGVRALTARGIRSPCQGPVLGGRAVRPARRVRRAVALVSGGFLHSGVFHLGMNMLLLWVLSQEAPAGARPAAIPRCSTALRCSADPSECCWSTRVH